MDDTLFRSLVKTDGKSVAPSMPQRPLHGGCLYPHPDLPFFPNILLKLAGERSIIAANGDSRKLSEFATLKPGDFSIEDAGHWGEQIAELIQTLLYSRKSMPTLAALRIDVPNDFRLTNLILSDRARVALQGRSFFDPAGQWRHCSLLELASTHAMGAKLTLAFLLAIENGNKENQSQPQSQSQEKPCLESDLAHLIRSALYAERSAGVFSKANGWGGHAQCSLAQISEEHGISKERTRQILALSDTSMARQLHEASAPASLTQALDCLHEHAPMSAKMMGELLCSKGLSKKAFHPQGVINAAQRHGLSVEVGVFKLPNGAEVVIAPKDLPLLNQARQWARSIARSCGVMCSTWLIQKGEQNNVVITPALAQIAIGCESQLKHLVSCGGEFWHWPGCELRPSGVIVRCLKLIAFFGRCSTDVFERDLRGMGARIDLDLPAELPTSALLALLTCWGLTQDKSGQWVALEGPSRTLCEQALPVVEKEIADLIASHPVHLDKMTLRTLASERNINANTLQSYLRRSALIAPAQSRMGLVHLAITNLGT